MRVSCISRLKAIPFYLSCPLSLSRERDDVNDATMRRSSRNGDMPNFQQASA